MFKLHQSIYWPIFLGILYGFSFWPSVFLGGMGLVTLGLGLSLISQQPNHYSFFKSVFLFFVISFCINMHWLYYAFDTVKMAHFGPFAVLALSCVLSLFYVPLGFVLKKTCSRSPTERILCAAICLASCEFLRGHLFTGLPWNCVIHLWAMQSLGSEIMQKPLLNVGLWFTQISHIFGFYGANLWSILIIAFIFSRSIWLRSIGFFSLLCTVFWGYHQLSLNNDLSKTSYTLRLVQPCVDPAGKWSAEVFNEVLQKQMELSLEGRTPHQNLRAIIWPEAAVPTALNLVPELCEEFSKVIPKDGYLITGTVIKENGKIYSAIAVLDHFGKIKAIHKKSHLVPFGEYMPFSKWIPFHKLTPGTMDYSFGDGVRTLSVQNIPPFSPLLCFEAIFPGEILEKADGHRVRPQWILNLTNDAWYQDSVGLWQHLACVRMRAIEERLPLVRVSNNGITASMDAFGRILKRTEINKICSLDVTIGD